MSEETGLEVPANLALVYSVASFRRSIGVDHFAGALRTPDIDFVVVDLEHDRWKALEADRVAERLTSTGYQREIETVVSWFDATAFDATPNFAQSRLFLPSRNLAPLVTYVLSGIEIPGWSPRRVGYKRYACNGKKPNAPHHVTRPKLSAGSTCGEPCEDQTPCIGTLAVY